MNKLFYLFLCLMCCSLLSIQAQPNGWIDYSKTYYKIKVGKNGLYRIPFSTLQAENVGNLAGSSFRLYNRGQQVPIYVTTNSTLGANDYIEFIGEINDGYFDTQLYADADWQLNPYSSNFSDTSVYYLVGGITGSGLRYANTTNNISNPPAPEPYFMHTVIKNLSEFESTGMPFRIAGVNHNYPDFEDGEGFASNTFGVGPPFNDPDRSVLLNTPAKYSGAGMTALLETKILGKSNDFSDPADHSTEIRVNDITYALQSFEGYENIRVTSDILLSSLTSNTTTVEYITTGTNIDNISIAYTKLTYPRLFDFDNQSYMAFTLENSQQKYLEISNFNAGSNPVLYDMTNRIRLLPVLENGVYKVLLPAGTNSSTPRKLFMANTSGFCTLGCTVPNCIPTQCSTWTVGNIDGKQFTNFGVAANQGNYLIITNSKLRNGATDYPQEYANYRESAAGGSFNVVLANTEELYDQFAHGIAQHPMAIRSFIDYLFSVQQNDPEYLLLLGKSVRYTVARLNPTYHAANLVPTFGFPSSDNMLSVANINSYYQRLATGRISANTPEQVRDYLEKVQQYEADLPCTQEARGWTKNFAHVSSGWSNNESQNFTATVDAWKEVAEQPFLGADVIGTYPYCGPTCSPNVISYPQFHADINNGLAMIAFMGHSAGIDSLDYGSLPYSPAVFNNVGKYPFILTGSCFVGDVHQYYPTDNNPSMSEKYVLADQKGAIAYMGTVLFGIPTYLEQFGNGFYNQFSNFSYGQSMGYCMLKALQAMVINDPNASNYEGTKVTVQEYTFEGDPGIKLVSVYEQPEYLVSSQSIQITDPNTGNVLTGSPIQLTGLSSINVQVNVLNLGQAVQQNIAIRIMQNGSQIASVNVPSPLNNSTYTIPVNLTGLTGEINFSVLVDANNAITEDCENNNSVIFVGVIQSANCQNVVLPTIANSVPTTYCTSGASVPLSATPSGGTFTLDGTAISNTFNPANHSPGTHLLGYSYTDNEGCIGSTQLSITINATPSSAINASATSICLGQSVVVQPNSFDQNATYTWNFGGGAATSTGQIHSVQWNTPGTKVITLNASIGNCIAQQSTVTVVVSAPLAQPQVTCGNANDDQVTFNWDAVAGSNGYLVSVDGGMPSSVFTNTFTQGGLTPGDAISIQVTAIGTAPCDNSTPSLVQTCFAQNCSPITPLINNLNSVYCQGGAPVTLSGFPNGGTFTVNGETATTFDPAQTGDYAIQYSITIGACIYNSAPSVVSVLDNPAPPQITGSPTVCTGGSTVLSAEDGFATYLWDIGATTAEIVATQAGEYSVTVTTIDGCSANNTFTLVAIPEPALSISLIGGALVCNSNSISLIATPGFLSYQWSTSNVGLPPNELSVVSGGIYSVTVTDFNSCEWTESVNVQESNITAPTITVNGTSSTQVCGTSAVLEAVGTGYTSYSWSNGENTASITATSGGTYSVTVSNANGCQIAQSVNLQLAGTLSPNIVATLPQICQGETSNLSVGTFASYLWSSGATTEGLAVTQAGTYTVTVSDVNGCVGTDEVTIGVNPNSIPTAAFSVSDSQGCIGMQVSLDNNSVNAATYQWTITNQTSGTVIESNEAEPGITLTEPGQYDIVLVANATCGTATSELSRETAVLVSPGPTISVSSNVNDICPGDEVELTAATNASAVTWTANAQSIAQTTLSIVQNPMTETIYMASVVDNVGCVNSDTLLVRVAESCELPNAITPNDDNFNDTWQIPAANTNNKVSVQIFNRWGQMVYENNTYNNASAFDGKNSSGDDLTHGTYYYLINYNDGSDVLSGTLTIIR